MRWYSAEGSSSGEFFGLILIELPVVSRSVGDLHRYRFGAGDSGEFVAVEDMDCSCFHRTATRIQLQVAGLLKYTISTFRCE